MINPDAHRVERLQELCFGVGVARKGWLTKADVMNCLPLGKIERRRSGSEKRCGDDASSFLALRHEHRQAFAGAAGFQEFGHRQRMTIVAAIAQRLDQLRRAFGQNDVLFEHDRVAGKMRGFFFRDIDQVADMFADRALTVFIKRRRKPGRAAIRQRTKNKYRDDKSADRPARPR